MRESFTDFWQGRVIASNEFLRGDPAPLAAITSRDAILFDPRGRKHVGYEAVVRANAIAARRFRGVRKNDFEPLQIHHDNDAGFVSWVGIQHSVARLCTGELQTFDQRMAETYVYEEDGWKWSLRYATPLITESEMQTHQF